jgi:DNA-binding transcriptional MerR regulator
MSTQDPQLLTHGEAAASTLSAQPADSNQLSFGIGDLAGEFAISTRTIRFYEDKGLLAPLRQGTTRIYSRKDRARLELILLGKAIGCSLSEIEHYLELYGAHGEGREEQLKFVIERTQSEIEALERRRAHIDAQIQTLQSYNQNSRASLEELK